MSTRCNIVIRDAHSTTYLHHHHDGYPEGVGVQLRKALNIPTGERKECNAWATRFANKLIKNQAGLNDNGYELTTGLHGDIEYVYDIYFGYESVTLKCQEITFSWDEESEKYTHGTRAVDIPEWDGKETMYE